MNDPYHMDYAIGGSIGIDDGAEYHYWQERLYLFWSGWVNSITGAAVNYTLNPDVDGDNITDGKEIKGYSVKIITDWDSKGEPM